MRKALILLGLVFVAMVGWLNQQTKSPTQRPSGWSLSTLLGDAPDGFQRVTGPVPFDFPADHAAHLGFRNEWWYFTGRLDAGDHELGFQFTLFRFGVNPPDEQNTARTDLDASAWASDHLWMAHLALSDGGTTNTPPRFYQAERFARDTLGLAGATESAWWLKDWRVSATDTGWQLEASTDEFGLSLDLVATRPITLQGDKGFSQKGPEVGNASHYYSLTRMIASGEVTLHEPDTRQLAVEGLAWLDREWGSGQLSDTQSGWDWFAIHLEDGRDLMVYRLRNLDDSMSAFSAGVLVEPDGTTHSLDASDFVAEPMKWWTDSSGVAWPTHWTLTVPEHGLSLITRPLFESQRWTKSVAYWEGAINVFDASKSQIDGENASTQVGRGYLELSGYSGRETPRRRASQKTPTQGE